MPVVLILGKATGFGGRHLGQRPPRQTSCCRTRACAKIKRMPVLPGRRVRQCDGLLDGL